MYSPEETIPKVTYGRNLTLGLRESDPAIEIGDEQDETNPKEPYGRSVALAFRASDPTIEIGDKEEGTSPKVTYRRNIALGIRISDPPVATGYEQEQTQLKVPFSGIGGPDLTSFTVSGSSRAAGEQTEVKQPFPSYVGLDPDSLFSSESETTPGKEQTEVKQPFPSYVGLDPDSLLSSKSETTPEKVVKPGSISTPAKPIGPAEVIQKADPVAIKTHAVPTVFEELEEEEKSRQMLDPSLCKCIALFIFILGVIVGTITGVSLYITQKANNNGTRGIVVMDHYPPEECKNIIVALGDEIIIECFINDDTWMNSRLPVRIEAIHNNPLLNVNVSCSVSGKNVTCKPGKANCSSRGRFDIQFFDSFDRNAVPEFTKSVVVNIDVPPPYTTIQQDFTGNGDDSVFDLDCKYEKYCDNYGMQFYGDGFILADPLECIHQSYTDTEGHAIQCTATVPENVVYKYGNGSQLFCQLTNGQNVHQKSIFHIPGCEDFSKSNSNCSQTTTELYQCNSNTDGTLNRGHSKCQLIEACYPLRHFPSQNGTCKLGWCRNATDLHIDKNGDSLFVPLCNL